jgi:hypothetical protein
MIGMQRRLNAATTMTNETFCIVLLTALTALCDELTAIGVWQVMISWSSRQTMS